MACSATAANDPAGVVNSSGTTNANGETTISYRNSATLSALNLRVAFDTVLSDSRCPSTVQCVWAGAVSVQLSATSVGGSGNVALVRLSTVAGSDTATVLGQPLRLVRVEPARSSQTPLPLSSYRVVLRVGG